MKTVLLIFYYFTVRKITLFFPSLPHSKYLILARVLIHTRIVFRFHLGVKSCYAIDRNHYSS